MKNYVDKLDRAMFEDVVCFFVSEPGAMGPNDMSFYKRNGESFYVNYKSKETPYMELRELFPLIKECCFNGPMRSEAAAAKTIVIGGTPNDRETHVAKGWRHIYLDFGNHLAVREELYYEIKEIFKGKENSTNTYNWIDILDHQNFSERIPEIEENFHKQQKKDELIDAKLAELVKNPEYIKDVKAASEDLDKMMEVFERYSGIKMSWFELKQFGFRQAGVY